jgi:hypothetical protein
MTFAGLLFNCALNTACRILGRWEVGGGRREAEWWGKSRVIRFLTRICGLTAWKADLSHGRLMRFNRAIGIQDFFRLVAQSK